MLGIVILWCVVYLSGMLVCKIGMEKETSRLWKHLVGFFFLFFCQGAVFFAGQLVGWSFGKSRQVLLMVLGVVSLLAILVCRKDIGKMLKKIKENSLKNIPYGRYKALTVWLFIGVAAIVITGAAGNRNDAMVEMVQTTLLTDTMNVYHPFTRQPLELGVILSKKLITLPFWYSALSIWSGMNATDTVWILGTLVTTLFSLMAFGELSGLLFGRNFRKSWLLVILLELLYLSGDYYVGAAGYRQLWYGYSGEVIVATVIIPSVFCILYRFSGPFFRKEFPQAKEGISLWGVLVELGLCMGSCLFLTSFVWGILLVVIAIGLFFMSMAGVRYMKRFTKKGEDLQ